jgi:hypothetical protein
MDDGGQNCLLFTAYRLLLTAYWLVLSAWCLVLSVFCLLPSAYWFTVGGKLSTRLFLMRVPSREVRGTRDILR